MPPSRFMMLPTLVVLSFFSDWKSRVIVVDACSDFFSFR